MTQDHFSRIRELFPELLRVPLEERPAWLDAACAGDRALRGELESLLDGHDTRPLVELGGLVDAVLGEAAGGDPVRIGDYRVLERIGQGGMGTVYLARQETPRRRVAVKMIRRGLLSDDLARRFVFEVEVLGKLQDPGIARIYDAGVATVEDADGATCERPFFAMEYVEGRDLLSHAEAADLSLDQRLEIVARIADAVESAHKQGVIHRDLKPGNVLVDSTGRPKVLDFGAARAVDADVEGETLVTHAGQIVGTLPYMSPEQVSGGTESLDTRVDVYALGVILYELLAGRLPLDLRTDALATGIDRIRSEEPPRLGTLDPRLRGDVETIVAKALAKEKPRRYQSAAELAADLRRHLADEPIHARPSSTVYQVRKFAKRHKGLVAGLAFTLLALVGGIVSTSLETVRANRLATLAGQREREAKDLLEEARVARDAEAEAARTAEEKRVEALEVRLFFEDVLDLASPSKRGVDVKLVAALDEIVRGLEEKEPTETFLRHEPAIRTAVGSIYRKIGRHADAEKHLRRALLALEDRFPGDTITKADALFALGRTCAELSELGEALSLYDRGLAMLERLGGDTPKNLAPRMLALGSALTEADDLAGGRKAHTTALDLYRRHEGPARVKGIAACLGNLATLDRMEGDLDAASRRYDEALRLYREHGLETTSNVAAVCFHSAAVSVLRGRNEEALDLYRQAVDIGARALGTKHPLLGTLLTDLGLHYQRMERPDDAEEALLRARAILESSEGASARLAMTLMALGTLYTASGRLDEAEPLVLSSLSSLHSAFGATHRHTITARRRLSDLRRAQGHLDQSERILREILDDLEPASRLRPTYERELAEVLIALERPAEARPLLRSALATFTELHGPDSSQARKVATLMERLTPPASH